MGEGIMIFADKDDRTVTVLTVDRGGITEIELLVMSVP
jgi:hypothetical protein